MKEEDPHPHGDDRRRWERCRVEGSAMVSARGNWWGPFRIEDLSLGGACLEGQSPVPDDPWVQVVLRFSSRTTAMSAARVVWRKEAALAVAFEDLAPEDERAIEEALMPVAAEVV